VKLSEVKEILKAEVVFGEHKLDLPVQAAAGSDLMSDLLTGPTAGVLLLSGLNNLQVIRTSVIAGIAALVIVRGKKPDPVVVAQARDHDLPVLSTPFTMYTACGRLFREGLRGVERKLTA
jgi:predicted transcriptional regulator